MQQSQTTNTVPETSLEDMLKIITGHGYKVELEACGDHYHATLVASRGFFMTTLKFYSFTDAITFYFKRLGEINNAQSDTILDSDEEISSVIAVALREAIRGYSVRHRSPSDPFDFPFGYNPFKDRDS